MTQAIKKLYTVEEYFALEEQVEEKHEYYHGEIIPMAGGSINHDRITGNIYSALNNAFFDRECEAFTSDMKLQIKVGDDYTYPDAMALCGKAQLVPPRKDVISNPTVIVEVLSKSTQKEDRTTKFDRYKEISSFQTYVVIAQKQVLIECYTRQPDNSRQKEIYNDLAQSLKLPVVNVEIPLSRIYNKVDFSLAE
jgi:Uma2 family endonuclease